LYAACYEGISKAWIPNITGKNETATAIGAFTAINSIFTMIASFLVGIIWFYFGPAVTMFFSSAAVLFITLYFIILVPKKTV
jgi:membrane protein YdbS with pleckstrin-like domain